jgi:putative transposase
MRPRRPTRIPGFPYRGCYCYSLRFGTFNRVNHFKSSALVAGALLQIQRTAEEDSFALIAYCFMPDHVHLAVEGSRPDSDLRRFVKVAKQRVAYIARTEFQIPCVWQDGYYERVLRTYEGMDTLVRYILDNPVRAGLVQCAEEFPHSGAMYWPDYR